MAGRPVSLFVPAAFPAELLANRGDHETNLVARLEARREPGRGAGRDRGRVRAAGARLSGHEPRGARRGGAARPGRDARRARLAAPALGLRRRGAGDRVSQRGQPAGRARALPTARAGDHERARRLSLAARDGAARGEPAARARRRRARAGARAGTADGLVSFAPAGTPRIDEAALDARVLAFSLLVTLATGVLFGLLPALSATRAQPAALLQTGGREHSSRAVLRWRGVLVTVRWRSRSCSCWPRRWSCAAWSVCTPWRSASRPSAWWRCASSCRRLRYPDAPRRLAFFEELERRLSARPGVESVAFANACPSRRLGHRRRGRGPADRIGGAVRRRCPGGQPRLLPSARHSASCAAAGWRRATARARRMSRSSTRTTSACTRPDANVLGTRFRRGERGALGERRRRRGLAATRRPRRRAHAADLPSRRPDRHLSRPAGRRGGAGQRRDGRAGRARAVRGLALDPSSRSRA